MLRYKQSSCRVIELSLDANNVDWRHSGENDNAFNVDGYHARLALLGRNRYLPIGGSP